MKRALLLLALVALIGGLMGDPAEAEALSMPDPNPKPAPKPAPENPDKLAVEGILSRYKSPLPPWTIIAFKGQHPDFDIAGYLTVMMCESSLGTTGGSAKYNNPGNIKYMKGSDKIWHTLATGKWFCKGQGWYNTYASMYYGQRAAIRLIYDAKAGYNAKLAAHQWSAFGRTYFGANVPGLQQYLRNLQRVHASIVKQAAAYGAQW